MERVPKRIKLILLKKKRKWDFLSNFACYLTYSRNIKTECPRSRVEAAVPFFIHNNSLQYQYNFT